jgi:hypothetical protein
VEVKERELEGKLREVDDQIGQQSVIEELKESYEEKLRTMDNEQLIITQVLLPEFSDFLFSPALQEGEFFSWGKFFQDFYLATQRERQQNIFISSPGEFFIFCGVFFSDFFQQAYYRMARKLEKMERLQTEMKASSTSPDLPLNKENTTNADAIVQRIRQRNAQATTTAGM